MRRVFSSRRRIHKLSPTLFSLRLKPELRVRLSEEARLADRSASQLANEAIEAYLAARADKREQLEAAMVEADKGAFISSEAIHRWMKSWDTDTEPPPPEPDVFE
jgi:predicted transcriptional regulator